MDCREFVSFVKTWFFNLFNCVKDFNNNSLEEVFVPLTDNKEVEIIVPEVDNSLIEPNDNEYADVPELLPIEQLPSVDNEEYGFEQELENIDTSSDDDDYQYYYHE